MLALQEGKPSTMRKFQLYVMMDMMSREIIKSFVKKMELGANTPFVVLEASLLRCASAQCYLILMF